MLELLADDEIQNHTNRGSGHTNYLSSNISEEQVGLMGNQVLNEISRIKLFSFS